MPNGKSIRTWTVGATTGLVAGALIGGILAAATASSPTPCAPQGAAVTAPALPARTAAPKVTAARPTRWTERPTQYASGDHLWFSWRSSMVHWLGGQPVPTTKEQRAASNEGWWGETVNTPPSAVAYVPSDR